MRGSWIGKRDGEKKTKLAHAWASQQDEYEVRSKQVGTQVRLNPEAVQARAMRGERASILEQERTREVPAWSHLPLFSALRLDQMAYLTADSCSNSPC